MRDVKDKYTPLADGVSWAERTQAVHCAQAAVEAMLPRAAYERDAAEAAESTATAAAEAAEAAEATTQRLTVLEARLNGALATALSAGQRGEERQQGVVTRDDLQAATEGLKSKMMALAEASDGCWQEAMATIEQGIEAGRRDLQEAMRQRPTRPEFTAALLGKADHAAVEGELAKRPQFTDLYAAMKPTLSPLPTSASVPPSAPRAAASASLLETSKLERLERLEAALARVMLHTQRLDAKTEGLACLVGEYAYCVQPKVAQNGISLDVPSGAKWHG